MKCRLKEYKESMKELVIWKDKQDWQTLRQTNQKKKIRGENLIKLEVKIPLNP
jgi:hypothetical protein